MLKIKLPMHFFEIYFLNKNAKAMFRIQIALLNSIFTVMLWGTSGNFKPLLKSFKNNKRTTTFLEFYWGIIHYYFRKPIWLHKICHTYVLMCVSYNHKQHHLQYAQIYNIKFNVDAFILLTFYVIVLFRNCF